MDYMIDVISKGLKAAQEVLPFWPHVVAWKNPSYEKCVKFSAISEVMSQHF